MTLDNTVKELFISVKAKSNAALQKQKAAVWNGMLTVRRTTVTLGSGHFSRGL